MPEINPNLSTMNTLQLLETYIKYSDILSQEYNQDLADQIPAKIIGRLQAHPNEINCEYNNYTLLSMAIERANFYSDTTLLDQLLKNPNLNLNKNLDLYNHARRSNIFNGPNQIDAIIFEKLLAAGADINAHKTNDSRSLLAIAALEGNDDSLIFNILLNHDKTELDESVTINVRNAGDNVINQTTNTVLGHLCANTGNFKLITITKLIEKGAEYTLEDALKVCKNALSSSPATKPQVTNILNAITNTRQFTISDLKIATEHAQEFWHLSSAFTQQIHNLLKELAGAVTDSCYANNLPPEVLANIREKSVPAQFQEDYIARVVNPLVKQNFRNAKDSYLKQEASFWKIYQQREEKEAAQPTKKLKI